MSLTNNELKLIANNLRIKIIDMLWKAGSGHPGGSLSLAEILTTLFWHEMKYADNPGIIGQYDRPRLILSKGHAAPALYAALAELGHIPLADLDKLRKVEGHLEGHPEITIPGVEMSTGSLGQGLSVSIGLALALKQDQLREQAENKWPEKPQAPAASRYRVYTILGDGELQEGMVWEAAMSAAHFGVDNLCAFADLNNLQIDGHVDKIMGINPIADKFRAFGWHVLEIDGHDYNQIKAGLDEARLRKGQPSMILAKTTKGKGVSFMEDKVGWHGVAPNDDERNAAIAELENRKVELESDMARSKSSAQILDKERVGV